MMKAAKEIPASRIDAEFLSALSTVAMHPYLIVVVVVLLCFGVWALFRGPGSEHRRKYDLNTLIKKQSNIFPIVSPFIDFNPAKLPPRPPGAPVPAELPIFAEALSPEEWIVYNEIPVVDQKLDQEATTKAFAKQLGSRWRGAKHLEPYKQVLLAACCLKAARKRADADAMLGKLAQCWSDKKGLHVERQLLREARSVLSNGTLSSSTLKKCNEHAWETTALMRALTTAREEGGVLAPAQFVWLRAHDRALWYPLNNLGRQSLHMEAIGATAHFKAEKLAQRPIPRPKVSDSVKSLSEYIESPRARALPQLDYSGSKKRGVKKLKTA
jgi:intracellular multiplication protein IcmP